MSVDATNNNQRKGTLSKHNRFYAPKLTRPAPILVLIIVKTFVLLLHFQNSLVFSVNSPPTSTNAIKQNEQLPTVRETRSPSDVRIIRAGERSISSANHLTASDELIVTSKF